MSDTQDKQPADEHGDASAIALRAELAALRQCRTPSHDLWAGIEARLPARGETAPAADDETEDTALASALRVLRRDAAPARELWSGIEARIRVQRARRVRAPWLAAASLAASLVLVLGLQVQRGSSPAAAHAPLHASAAVLSAMAQEPIDPALMPTSIHPLAPETRALVRANLKIVNSAETQVKRALADDPDAAYLESLLATAQQQKQELRVVLADRH